MEYTNSKNKSTFYNGCYIIQMPKQMLCWNKFSITFRKRYENTPILLQNAAFPPESRLKVQPDPPPCHPCATDFGR